MYDIRTYGSFPQEILTDSEAELPKVCLDSDDAGRQVYVELGQLTGPEVVLVVDPHQTAVVAEDNGRVVVALIPVVTELTAVHHGPKVGSNVDLVLGGQTTQSVLDKCIFHSFVFIAGVGSVSHRGNELQEWSENVSVFLPIAVYSF